MKDNCDHLLFTIDAAQAGMRLDLFLKAERPEYSRTFLQSVIDSQGVTVNQRQRPASWRLEEGDVIEAAIPIIEKRVLQPEAIPLDILFEDDSMMVLNKPAGLVVHPANGNYEGTLAAGLLSHDPECFNELLDDDQRPGIVHRLDKETSGCLVIAKSPEAFEALKASFKEHAVTKLYLAVVQGVIKDDTGVISAPIGRDPKARMRMAVVSSGGKEALTKFKVASRTDTATLVLVRLYTGRTHQIRVHFAHLGHPVVGDHVYGPRKKNPHFNAPRQLLHAWKIALPHPSSGEELRFTAPPPDDFMAALADFNVGGLLN